MTPVFTAALQKALSEAEPPSVPRAGQSDPGVEPTMMLAILMDTTLLLFSHVLSFWFII